MAQSAGDALGLDLAEVARWFELRHEHPYRLIDIPEAVAQDLAARLGLALRRCYVADDLLTTRAGVAAQPELIAARLPDPGSTMSGDFGEILTLVQIAGDTAPNAAYGPIKWRLKQDRTKPAPHSDVLVFLLPAWPASSGEDVLHCAEVKAKATRGRSEPILDALRDSAKDRTSRLARTLVWLRERALHEDLEGAELAMVERFINASDHPPATRKFHAVAVLAKTVELAEVAKVPAALPTETTLRVLVVPEMKSVYEAVYEAASACTVATTRAGRV